MINIKLCIISLFNIRNGLIDYMLIGFGSGFKTAKIVFCCYVLLCQFYKGHVGVICLLLQ